MIITMALVILRYWGSKVRPKKLGLFQCIHSQFSTAAQSSCAFWLSFSQVHSAIASIHPKCQDGTAIPSPNHLPGQSKRTTSAGAPGLLSILVVYSLTFGASQKGREHQRMAKKP